MTLRWRNCREADREHEDNERQYAHTYHYADTICLADAFWDLPKRYRDGILLHEIGHLLVGPDGSEQDATDAAGQYFNVPIEYADSPYGRDLERVSNMGVRIINRRRVNPESMEPWEFGSEDIPLQRDYAAEIDEINEEIARTRDLDKTVRLLKKRSEISRASMHGMQNPPRITQRDVNYAAASYHNNLMQYGENNMATQRAEWKYRDLKRQYEEQQAKARR